MTADGGTKPEKSRESTRQILRDAAIRMLGGQPLDPGVAIKPADGGTKPEKSGKEPVWNNDRARIALEKAAEVYVENPVATPKYLRQNVPNYQLIPEEIRQNIEALSAQEHLLLKRILDLLDDYDIYLYSRSGGSTPEYPLGIPALNPVFPTGGY